MKSLHPRVSFAHSNPSLNFTFKRNSHYLISKQFHNLNSSFSLLFPSKISNNVSPFFFSKPSSSLFNQHQRRFFSEGIFTKIKSKLGFSKEDKKAEPKPERGSSDELVLNFLKQCAEKGKFDMNDFRTQLEKSLTSGKAARIAQYIPGFSQAFGGGGELQEHFKEITKKYIKIIDAMTEEERTDPSSLFQAAGKAKMRIAESSGTTNAQVNVVLSGYMSSRMLFDHVHKLKQEGKPIPSTVQELTQEMATSKSQNKEMLSLIKMKNRGKAKRK